LFSFVFLFAVGSFRTIASSNWKDERLRAWGDQQEIKSLTAPNEMLPMELEPVFTIRQHDSNKSRRIRFGAFELDSESRELWRRGTRVKLQQKPFQILQRLLDTPGEMVSRAQLAQLLWPGMHVAFEGSLNTAVNTLRRVLRDPWRHPRYIETRPGIGYRLIAPVQRNEAAGSSDARQDYRKGRYFQSKATEEDARKSIAYFQAALAADPDCAPAYAGLADSYNLFAQLGLLPAAEAYHRSREYAEAALRLDRRLADAHLSFAGVLKLEEWDWAGAEAAYLRAIELNPNCARAHQKYAALLSARGRHNEAARTARVALDLDPTSLAAAADAAWMLCMARDFQAAAEQSWKALAMDSKFAPAQNTLGLAYQHMGMLEEAIVEFGNACVCGGRHPAALAALGCALAAGGEFREAQDIRREMEQMSQARNRSSYWISMLDLALGERQAAMDALRQAHRDRDPWIVWIGVEPRFDALRGQPEFEELSRSIFSPGG
jgi:DNA-binding winged helix-turn-helix (wHTH) protein/Flp pilus assembly protein TadD